MDHDQKGNIVGFCLINPSNMKVSLLSICVVLFLFPSCISECRFPDFLQTEGEGPSWYVTYHNKEVSITVNHTRMMLNECRTKGHAHCQLYERNCAVSYGGSRFLVREFLKDRTTYETEITYRCIQFLRRSKSVVQIRISLYNSKDSSHNLCNDQHLVLDQYPMISREHATEVNECPTIGGFDFKLYHYGDETPLCDDIFLPLRIESDCTQHEGIKLYFRRRNCSNLFVGRDMKLDLVEAEPVEIRCVASWKYMHYTFAIVKWRGTPKFWCIRVTYLHDKINEMFVYFSGICPSDNKHYERMLILRHFKTHYVTGICADQNMKCSYHHCSTYKDKCKLSCALCEPDMEEKSCIFPPAFYGRWNSLHSATSALGISNSTLKYQDMSWECVESKSHNRLEIIGRHALKLKFSNGCYPRYMCTEIEHPTSSVIRYRTGKELFWPIDSIDDVCEDRFFDYRPHFAETSGIARTSGPWVYFIKESPEYVNCNLPWYIKNSAFFEMYDNKNKLANQGCLSYDNTSPGGHVLELYYTYQNLRQEWSIQTQKTFFCIASIKIIGENDVLITHNIRESVYMCWTFVQDRYRNYVYIFSAKNCGNGTNKQLVFFSAQKYIAMLVLRKNSTVCDLIGNEEATITRRSDEDILDNLTENNTGSLAYRPHLAINLIICITLVYNIR